MATLQELKENIREAVALYLDSLRENNEPVPEPTVQADVGEAA